MVKDVAGLSCSLCTVYISSTNCLTKYTLSRLVPNFNCAQHSTTVTLNYALGSTRKDNKFRSTVYVITTSKRFLYRPKIRCSSHHSHHVPRTSKAHHCVYAYVCMYVRNVTKQDIPVQSLSLCLRTPHEHKHHTNPTLQCCTQHFHSAPTHTHATRTHPPTHTHTHTHAHAPTHTTTRTHIRKHARRPTRTYTRNMLSWLELLISRYCCI